MNVGSVNFDITIGHIAESIAQTKKLTDSLVAQDKAIRQSVSGYNAQRKAGASALAANKRLTSFNKSMLKGIYDIRKAAKDMTSVQKQEVSVLKKLHTARTIYNREARKDSGFKAFSRAATATKNARIEMDKMHASALKMNTAWKSNTLSRISRSLNTLVALFRLLISRLNLFTISMNRSNNAMARTPKRARSTTTAISKQASAWTRLKIAMQGAGSGYNTWWKRFGVIAIGFAVAYRAIYAFQMGVASLTRNFFGGLVVMDDYKEGLATIAGMIALTYKSNGDYSSRFVAAQKLMSKSMENAMRLAPKYRMSMEEITAGFRELSQFGVIVTPEQTEKSINTLATIKEISMSTGSVTKQLRQEIQALFQGQARVTDQFTRMIKITMPDLYRTLQDGAISTAKKWEILTDRIWDFNQSVRESNQTVKNQALIAKGTLQIISKMAVEHSGIFAKWVKSIRDFNEKLFDVKGNLLPLGQKIEEIFADIWTSIDYSVKAIIDMYKVLKDVFTVVKDTLEPWKKTIVVTAKTLALMFGIKTVLSIILSIITGLLSATGITSFIKLTGLLVTWLSKLSIFLADITPIVRVFSAALIGLVAEFAAVATAFGVGIVAGNGLVGAWSAAAYVGKKVWENFANFVSTQFDYYKAKLALFIDDIKSAWKNHGVIKDDTMRQLAVSNIKSLDEIRKKADGIDIGKIISDGMNVGTEAIKKNLAGFKTGLDDMKDIVLGAVFGDSDDSYFDNFKKSLKDKASSLQKIIGNMFSGPKFDGIKEHMKQLLDDAVKIAGDGKNNLIPTRWSAKEDYMSMIGSPRADGQIDYKQRIIALDKKRVSITQQFKDITESIKDKSVDKVKGLTDQIALTTQLLSLAQRKAEYIKLDDNNKDSESYNKQLALIKKLQAELAKLRKTEIKFNETPVAGFTTGLQEWANGLDTVGEKFNKLGNDFLPNIASGLKSVFSGVFTGEITKFSDLWDKTMASIADSFAKAMSDMLDIYINQFLKALVKSSAQASQTSGLLNTVIGGIGSFFGFSGSSDIFAHNSVSGGNTWSPTNRLASGGVIPEHVWGIGASGQRYEFGENGPETVLSNKESFSKPAAPQVTVNVINKTTHEVNAQQGNTYFDGRRFVVEAVLDDIDRGGPLRSVMGAR